jgi:hypothetical protein
LVMAWGWISTCGLPVAPQLPFEPAHLLMLVAAVGVCRVPLLPLLRPGLVHVIAGHLRRLRPLNFFRADRALAKAAAEGIGLADRLAPPSAVGVRRPHWLDS